MPDGNVLYPDGARRGPFAIYEPDKDPFNNRADRKKFHQGWLERAEETLRDLQEAMWSNSGRTFSWINSARSWFGDPEGGHEPTGKNVTAHLEAIIAKHKKAIGEIDNHPDEVAERERCAKVAAANRRQHEADIEAYRKGQLEWIAKQDDKRMAADRARAEQQEAERQEVFGRVFGAIGILTLQGHSQGMPAATIPAATSGQIPAQDGSTNKGE